MGANAQTKVPTFASAEVLTAANQNLLSNGIPVFSGTATRNDAFGGSGEKVLAEGQFAYLEDSNTTQYYDGAAWQSVGVSPGFVFIAASGAQSAVANIAFNNCFSATYSNYKIIVENLSQSVGANSQFRLRVGGVDTVGTGYYTERYEVNAGAIAGIDIGGVGYWSPSYISSTADGSSMSIDIYRPFAAASTAANYQSTRTDSTTNIYGVGGSMFHNGATSFDGFNIVPASGTVTCTNIRVYGYSNS